MILSLFVTRVSACFSAEFSSMLGKFFDVVEGNSSYTLVEYSLWPMWEKKIINYKNMEVK